uniref:Bromo domain-containing protein n=1 Tax=Hyaloperonospora arabidopsidis (strain Emoy2) TaxID=559515 RepID=M4C262_HYAAE
MTITLVEDFVAAHTAAGLRRSPTAASSVFGPSPPRALSSPSRPRGSTRPTKKEMALTDLMSVEMSAKYMDLSSSSGLSSDSDSDELLSSSSNSSELSSASSAADSDPPRASGSPSTGSHRRAGKGASTGSKEGAGRGVVGGKRGKKEKKIKTKKLAERAALKPARTASHAKLKEVEKTGDGALVQMGSPLPPPPPPPTCVSSDGNLSSNISVSGSSSSDSSDLSDHSETDLPPPPPPPLGVGRGTGTTTTSSLSRAHVRRPPASQNASQGASAASLKVTLKLPPGFRAKNSGTSVPVDSRIPHGDAQGTNSSRRARVPTSASRKASPAVGSVSQCSSRVQSGATAGRDAVLARKVNGTPLVGFAASDGPRLSTGPTVPAGEVRGARELSFVDPVHIGNSLEETSELNIPAHFNDPCAQEGDTLRLLDMFFFCDENGKAISLEILDRRSDRRPKIMGFGTVVEHVPLTERPFPNKPILASPAFPSRSKKRSRTDSSVSTPAKSPASKSRARPRVETKRAKLDTEIMYQGDGEFEEGKIETSGTGEYGIFHQSYVYHVLSPFQLSRLAQVDGHSGSHSESSDMTSDDENIRLGRSAAGGGSDNGSELQFSATNSSSGSDGDDDMGSSGESDGGDGAGMARASRRPGNEAVICKPFPPNSVDSEMRPVGQVQRRPSARVDSRNAGLPHDVVELMRTDQAVELDANGTPDELNLMECGFRHPPEYARARVWLPEITDWCLDYAEGDPTLWVVTPHAWYKIAGPLSGLLPHSSYRHTFKHVRRLFEASYLVAYVLKEWLPINKKVSYRATLQQIIEVSLKGRYRVNYPFIRAQVSNLFSDKEVYLESMFFKQLHRLHENYTLRVARHQKEMAEREARRVKRENERLEKKQRDEDVRQRLKDERDEERRQKEQEHKYPVEDLQLLEGEAVNTNCLPLSCSSLKGVKGPLLGELIMAWQTICTFKSFVGLESISLEALAECITTRSDEGTHVGLARIFMAFLHVILSEKSFMSFVDDLVVESNIKVSDLFVNCERTYGTCERAYGDMLNAVTWQEILRQLMSKDLGIDPSIGHVEPLVGCEIVRQTLYMQNNSAPFNAPVDMTAKGLEDYTQVIAKPMDLGTIKKTIDSGGYEGPDGHKKFAEDVRLVWDNAVLYNGEESEVGRAALALSDVFEQDYERLVVGRVRANQRRIEECEKAKERLKDPFAKELESFQYSDVVYGLYCMEFHELPSAYKIGALSWICSEFLTLSSVRAYLAAQVDQEMLIYKNHRKRAADLDFRRKQSDKMRREREYAFRRDCANQGIHPNSHNVFSEGIKRRHKFIGKFFEDILAEKIEDEKTMEQEKKVQAEILVNELSSIVIRESPLGKDRYHNSYFMFRNDTKPRLFIERGDTGDFVICGSKAQLTEIMEWLNPKGVRELDLLKKLQSVKNRLIDYFREKQDGSTPEIVWASTDSIELSMFPLRGGAWQTEAGSKSDIITITDADRVIDSRSIAQKMLLYLKQQLVNAKTLPASWEGAETWDGVSASSATGRVYQRGGFPGFAYPFGSEGVAQVATKGGPKLYSRAGSDRCLFRGWPCTSAERRREV